MRRISGSLGPMRRTATFRSLLVGPDKANYLPIEEWNTESPAGSMVHNEMPECVAGSRCIETCAYQVTCGLQLG